MNHLIIDTGARQLTLLDSRFYITEEGQPVPSVTTILEAYPKGPEYFAWIKKVGEDADEIRDEAGRRGSTVHALTEAYDRGEEVTLLTADGHPAYKLAEWAMFERYVEFTGRYNPDNCWVEQNFVSPALGFAGTVDRIMMINGRLFLVDIKTSNTIYPSYWLQLAAYRQLADEQDIFVDAVAVLWLNAKTRTEGSKGAIQGPGWQLVTREDTTRDYELFLATKTLWEAQNKDIRPRQLTYQLTHKK